MLSSPARKYEFRLYGLDTGDLISYFSTCVKVLGALVHEYPVTASLPTSQPTSWAQIWTTSEEEVNKCLTLKPELELKNITMTRAPQASAGWLIPVSKPMPRIVAPMPPSSPSFEGEHVLFRPESITRTQVDSRSLARNLYVLGIPINLTQQDFKDLFCTFGIVEHSTLLSQLDSSGRRRGFILMSTHREAVKAMSEMNGQIIQFVSADTIAHCSGYKLDISWALVQRENRNFQGNGAFPNRVIHPPVLSSPRESGPECSVLIENLDPIFFPDSATIAEVFAHFGPVVKATIIPSEKLTAIITFENKFSADGVVGSNGLLLGTRPIYTKSLVPSKPLLPMESEVSSRPLAVGPPANLPLFQPFGPPVEPQEGHNRFARPLPQVCQVPQPSTPRFFQALFDKVSPPEERSVADQKVGAIGDELKNLKSNSNVKLNPESQVFVPGTGESDGTATSQEFNSSSSVGSAGTRPWCQLAVVLH